MKKALLFLLAGVSFSATSQIAITEFMSNSAPNDTYHEWVELYNYSGSSVNLKNWKLADEDTDSLVISTVDLIMQPNTYLILAADKDSMQANWFGGVANSKVIAYSASYALGNTTDELVLKNTTGAVVWSIAYGNDDVTGVATFLEYSHNFSSGLTVWGSKAVPGINRAGIDPISTTTGYQGDSATVDGSSIPSALGDYKGSPLAGSYTPLNSTSINKVNGANKLTIYPNPSTTGEVNFSEPISGVMIDVTGKQVLEFTKQNKVEVRSLNEGIYFIVTDLGTYKFIIK